MKRRQIIRKTSSFVEVFNDKNNLDLFLRSIKGKKVNIVTAFASKTETVIDHLLRNGNKVTLLIGTINHFSDPQFIKYCQSVAKKNPSKLRISVDYRGDSSIHWKLYLIAPDIVIIGSANLTTIGLSMERDTAIKIRNLGLYELYSDYIFELNQKDDVIKSSDSNFNNLLAEYEKQHQRMLSRPRVRTVRSHKIINPPTLSQWLSEETSQVLPIFIWDEDLTQKDRRLFRENVQPQLVSSLSSIKKKNLYIIGLYKGNKGDRDYDSGNVILTMKITGAYIKFELAEFVIHSAGNWWLCGIKGRRVTKLFTLTPKVKRIMKNKANQWFDDDKSYLNSKDLRGLE